jgi:hypothetical protein
VSVVPIEPPSESQHRLSTMAAHQAKVRHIQRIVTPSMAFNAARIADYNPRLDSGIIGGMGMAGITPEDPVMEMINERQALATPKPSKYGQDGGIIGEWVWNPFKGLVRGAFMGLEGLMQEAESAIVRTGVGLAQGKSLGDAFGEAGRSDAFYAFNAALSGKRVHAGTGFFATDQTEDDAYIQQELRTGRTLADIKGGQEYQQQFAQYGVDPASLGEEQRSRMQLTHSSGKQTSVSLGRLAAIQVTEPGTQGFHMLSGLVDATKQIILDPADLALGGLGKAAKLRKIPMHMSNIEDASFATKALRSGLLPSHRKTFLARTWDDYLDSNTGRDVMNWVQTSKSERGNAGLREMYEVFGATQKGSVDPAMIRALHDSENLADIRVMLKDGAEGGQIRNTFGNAFDTFKADQRSYQLKKALNNTPIGRWASVTNSKMLNIADPNTAVADFDLYTKNLGLSQAKRDDLLERAIRIYDPEAGIPLYAGEGGNQDLYSSYFSLVKDATDNWVQDVLKVEAESPVSAAMTKIFNSEREFRSFWVDNMGDDVMFGGTRFTTNVNGQKLAVPSPILFSQFLDQSIPLMDPGAIRSAMNKSFIGKSFENAGASKTAEKWMKKTFGEGDFDKFGHSTMTNALDFMIGSVWKPSVLLRAAWPVRVIGEEQFRLSGKLMAGAFNHPLQYFALTGAHKSKALKAFMRMDNDAVGESLMSSSSFEEAMSGSRANISEALTGKKAAGADSFRYVSRPTEQMTSQEFLQSLTYELHQLEADDVAREVAGSVNRGLKASGEFSPSHLAEVKARFWKGDMAHMRKRMLRDNGAWDRLNSQAFAESYIDTVYSKLHQMGGGDGHLLNELTGDWRNFNGEVLDAQGVRAMYGSGGFGGVDAQGVKIDPKDIDPEAPFAGVEEAMGHVFVGDELDEHLRTIDQAWNDAYDQTRDGTEATDAMIRKANDIIDDAEEQGVKNTSKQEFIPTQEAQEGIGRFAAERRGPFNRMHQTEPKTAIPKETIETTLQQTMSEAMLDDAGARTLTNDSPLIMDELINSEYTSLVLNDYPDPATGNIMRTYMSQQRGNATGLIETYIDPDTGKMIGVGLAVGTDGADMEKLFIELVETGEMNLEQLLSFSTGDVRFMDWLNAKRVKMDLDEINDMDELFKMMDEDPALLKDFYAQNTAKTKPGEWVGDGSFEVGINPRQGPTSTTMHGANFSRRALSEARERSKEWGQHTEWFKMSKPGDPRIFELIAEGKIMDEAGNVALDWGGTRTATKRMTDNKAIKKQFNNRMAYFGGDTLDEWKGIAPAHMRQIEVSTDAKTVNKMDKGIDAMMSMFMSKPTDALSRSPAFRQFYWARATEMAAYLDDGDRAKFLANAEKANLLQAADGKLKLGSPMRTLRRYTGRENTVDEAIRRVGNLAGKPQAAEAGAITSIADLDEVAKAYALTEVKALLYDQSRSHNWAEMMRFVIPFGEAWWEVGSTWAGLMKENPRNIRRVQQAVQGARGADPFRDVGPDGEQGRGFFYTDPTTGDEIFSYPDPSIIPSWVPLLGKAGDVGGNLNLTGRVSGLNIMAGIMPGIGPTLQIPMSTMGAGFFDDVDNRWLRDILMPFGKSTVEGGDASTWLDPILPAYFQKALQSMGKGDESSKRLQANTTIDVYKTLLMQGWSDDNPTEMKKTLDEAKRIAASVTRIRAIASWMAPTGATQQWEVAYVPEDTTGDIWAYSNMSTAYRQLLDENQGDEVATFKNFSDIFGVDPMLFAVSKTQKVLPRAVTIEARKWEQDNEDLYGPDQFPLTAYFANPDDADGEFDYETYLLQLKEESREPVSPEQWALKRNQFLGRVAYSNFQRQADRRFEDAGQRTVWLQNTHSSLQELFPGYGQNIVGMPAKPSLGNSRTGQIGELYRWANDPRLAESDAGIALGKYLMRRDAVIRLTQSEYGYTTETGWRTGVRAVMNRRQLRSVGKTLAGEHPGFISLWQQILSRELEEPEATMQPVNLGGQTF